MMPRMLADIFAQFCLLSLLTIGGVNAIIPEIQRRVVEVERWIDNDAFAQAFAIAQVAPGPNLLVVSVIGWKVAGLLGAIVATVAICLPSSTLTFVVLHAWDRFRDAPLRIAIEQGIAPVTVGLVIASGFVLARTIDTTVPAMVLTAAVVVVAMAKRLHPLWLLGGGAAAGALGLL